MKCQIIREADPISQRLIPPGSDPQSGLKCKCMMFIAVAVMFIAISVSVYAIWYTITMQRVDDPNYTSTNCTYESVAPSNLQSRSDPKGINPRSGSDPGRIKLVFFETTTNFSSNCGSIDNQPAEIIESPPNPIIIPSGSDPRSGLI